MDAVEHTLAKVRPHAVRCVGSWTPFCSLVLATVGRSRELEPLLDSLVAQTVRDFELIVVDQNGDERLVPALAAVRATGIEVLHLRLRHANLALARNLGLARARGEVVAFPDDDCWYEPDLIEAVHAALDDGLDGIVARWIELRGDARDDGESLDHERWRALRGGDASSICLFLRRALFRRIGGFDDRLGVGRWYGAGEETDLVLRALAHGARLKRAAAAGVHHRHDDALPPLSLAACRRHARRARGTGALLAKHRLAFRLLLRALLTPPLRLALRHERRLDGFVQGLFVSFGHLQGYLRWKRREGRDRSALELRARRRAPRRGSAPR